MNPPEIAIAVADAVVAQLNAGVADGAFTAYWAAGFTVQRIYDTAVTLDGLSTLRVDVLYATPAIERETQFRWTAFVPIDIAIRQKASEDSKTVCDALAKLAGAIWDYMGNASGVPRVLADYATAQLEFPEDVEKDSPVVILADILHTHNQFTGIVRLTYRVAGQ
jgi:hypothetical protein